MNLGGGDRSSKSRVNARIISKGGGGGRDSGGRDSGGSGRDSGGSGGGMTSSRSLQRHLHGRPSLSNPRSSRSSSPRLSQSNQPGSNHDRSGGGGGRSSSDELKRNDRSYNSQSAPRSSNHNSSRNTTSRNNIMNIRGISGNSKINEFLSELEDDHEEVGHRGDMDFPQRSRVERQPTTTSSSKRNHRGNKQQGYDSGRGEEVKGGERSYYSNFASDVATGRRSRDNM